MKAKALIIRFNAIGDIVLTTPVISALAEANYEVHYLTKKAFSEILETNPHVDRVITLEDSLSDVIDIIKVIKYDVVIDLHRNIRSRRVSQSVSCPSYRLKKNRVALWALTETRWKTHKEKHIVSRFMDVLQPLGITEDNPQTEYYLEKNASSKKENHHGNYMVIAVGAAWKTKCIPESSIIHIVNNSSFEEIVLIGGPDDKEIASRISTKLSRPVSNQVGLLSINESAKLISEARVLLTGDTGMMHIAAAFGVPVVAVFGSTHPSLGYVPHYGNRNVDHYIIENNDISCRPCTKQGKTKCPKGHFKCMNDLSPSEILDKVDSFL